MASRIEYQNSPAQVMKRAVAAVRIGTEAAVAEWHAEIMPEHFTVAGGKKYSYQPRKGDDEPPRIKLPGGRTKRNNAYSWQKRRRFGHNKPLVYTGSSEAAARSAVKVSSRKKPGADGIVEGTAAMPNLPKYFYQRRKDHGAPDKPAELTRALPAEEQQLARTVERVAMQRMFQPSVARVGSKA